MTALLSLCVLIAIFYVTAQVRASTSIENQLQRQEDHIESVDKIAQENKRVIELLAARQAQQDVDIALIKGTVYGFGGLLAILQAVGLIKKKKDD